MIKKPFQAAFSALVPERGPMDGSVITIDGSTSVYTWYRTPLPFMVPDGMWLCIRCVHFGSKGVNHQGTRSSYLLLPNILTVPEHQPTVRIPSPGFIVPAGNLVRAQFWNNSLEQQWMTGFITGWLTDYVG